MTNMQEWHNQLMQLMADAHAIEETPDFQNGVVAGWHEGAISLVLMSYKLQKPMTEEQLRQKTGDKHSADWLKGFIAGYFLRLKKAEEVKYVDPE